MCLHVSMDCRNCQYSLPGTRLGCAFCLFLPVFRSQTHRARIMLFRMSSTYDRQNLTALGSHMMKAIDWHIRQQADLHRACRDGTYSPDTEYLI